MAQAPTPTLPELTADARSATKKLRNVARDAAKSLARFQVALDRYEEELNKRGIDLVLVDPEDSHSPEGAEE